MAKMYGWLWLALRLRVCMFLYRTDNNNGAHRYICTAQPMKKMKILCLAERHWPKQRWRWQPVATATYCAEYFTSKFVLFTVLLDTFVFGGEYKATNVWDDKNIPTHRKCTHQTTNETNWNAKRAKWLNRRQPTTTYRIVQNEALCAQRAIQTPTRPTGNGNYSEHKILATHVYGRSGILRYNNCVWDAIGAQSTETNSGATTNTAAAAETMQEKSKWDTRLYIYKYMWTMCPFHGTGISIYIYIRFK